MKQKIYYVIIGIVLLVVGVGHLVRAMLGSDVVIGGFAVPIWFSWVAAALLLHLGVVSLYTWWNVR